MKPKCFVIMPITTPPRFLEQYRGDQEHFVHVLEHLFKPAIESCGFEMIAPRAQGSEIIHASIIQNIECADMLFCDMSCLNPNVFFELGVRTALNKPVCLVRDELTDIVPFDLGVINHHTYSGNLHVWELKDEITDLVQHIQDSVASGQKSNSLWKYFSISASANTLQTAASGPDKLDYIIKQLETLREDVDVVSKRQRLRSLEDDRPVGYKMKLDRRTLELSDAITDARRRLDITVSEISELAKVDRVQIARLERGMRVRRSTALRICKVLGVDPNMVWWQDPPLTTTVIAKAIINEPPAPTVNTEALSGGDVAETTD